MPRFISIVLLLSIFLTISACTNNHKQPLEGQPISENPLLPLSTTNRNADPTEERSDTYILEEDQTISDEGLGPNEVPENEKQILEEAEQETIESEEIVPSPNFGIPQEAPEEQEKIKEVQSNHYQLLISEFQERWNAIALEQGTNFNISSLNKKVNGNLKATIKDNIELLIIPNGDRIQRVVIITDGKGRALSLNMLSAWSHLIYMFEQEINPHQVDEIFREFGVGPDVNLEQVHAQTVALGNIRYTVKPLENGYYFEATYINS